MNKAYHLYSHGRNVIARNESDYISINNKIAASCHESGASLLAFSIMSTHVHLLLETGGEDYARRLGSTVSKNYSISYNSTYGHSLGGNFMFALREIEGIQSIRNEMLYVMRNPVHHYVAMTPLGYRFSSSAYSFWEELTITAMKDSYLNTCVKVSDLSQRMLKKIARTSPIPGNWLTTPDGMLLPSSYLPLERIRAFWNYNVRSFLVDMNRNVLDSNQTVQKADLLDIKSSQYSDIQVCRMIDDYAMTAGCRSFHFLDERHVSRIRSILQRKSIHAAQIARCLWIGEK